MTKKQEGEILDEEIAEGLAALRRSGTGLFVSAVSGGLDLGFSILLGATVLTLLADGWPEFVQRFAVANAYAFGFVLVIIGRSELFTEQTTLAILPVLDGRAPLKALARLWGAVYAGNLVGAGAFAIMIALVAPALGIVEPSAFIRIGQMITDHPWWVMLFSAALAGWLMGLLSWLVSAARETISQILIVWMITFVIGFALLHHSILGFTEVIAAMIAGADIGPGDLLTFVVVVTIGNIIGGTVFVAGFKYTHATRSGRLRDVDIEPPSE